MDMLYKYRKAILILIVTLGFGLRFYGAFSMPITFDEMDDMPSAKEISISLKNPKLPLTDDSRVANSPMGHKYLIRLGWDIFGESMLGARIPFVLSGTVTILLVYFLVKMALGVKTALLASFLLSVSQFAIGGSRIADLNAVIPLVTVVSLLLFYRALKYSDKNMFLINGLVIGIGTWFKENIIFLIPIYIIFLLICREYRNYIKEKYIWISFGLTFLAVLPLILLSLNSDMPRFSYIYEESAIGVSLNAIGLYLGELILLIIKPFPELLNYVAYSLDMEYPAENFIFGSVILVAVARSIKSNKSFINMLVVCFLFNFIVFSILRRDNVISSYWALGSLDWGNIGFVPGVIIAAYMLYKFSKKKKKYGIAVVVFLAVYMFFRAWNTAATPLSCYFPIEKYCIMNQLTRAESLKEGNVEENIYLPKPAEDLAIDIFQGIYKVSDKFPEYKMEAALGLAEILIKKGNNNQSRKYIDYVLFRNPSNSKALIFKKSLNKK